MALDYLEAGFLFPSLHYKVDFKTSYSSKGVIQNQAEVGDNTVTFPAVCNQ